MRIFKRVMGLVARMLLRESRHGGDEGGEVLMRAVRI